MHQFPMNESGALYRWPLSKDGKVGGGGGDWSPDGEHVSMTVLAALAGMGLAYTLESQVTRELAKRRLVRVLEDWCPPRPGFYLYYPSGRLLSAAFRAFIDFMRSGRGASS